MDTSPAQMELENRVTAEIRFLDAALRNAYGCDYAFTIAGRGKIIGASNMVDGRILPPAPASVESHDAQSEFTADHNEAFNGAR